MLIDSASRFPISNVAINSLNNSLVHIVSYASEPEVSEPAANAGMETDDVFHREKHGSQNIRRAIGAV